MIQRTFSSPFFIRFQIRSDHLTELFEAKEGPFHGQSQIFFLSFHCSKSELTLCETPELVFSTILSSILSFPMYHHLSSIKVSRRMLRAREKQVSEAKLWFSRQARLPRRQQSLLLFSLFVFINFALQFFPIITRKTYSVLVTGKVK